MSPAVKLSYSLKTLLAVTALVASYLAGLSSSSVYRIVDEEFLRYQLQVERAENAECKREVERLQGELAGSSALSR